MTCTKILDEFRKLQDLGMFMLVFHPAEVVEKLVICE